MQVLLDGDQTGGWLPMTLAVTTPGGLETVDDMIPEAFLHT